MDLVVTEDPPWSRLGIDRALLASFLLTEFVAAIALHDAIQ